VGSGGAHILTEGMRNTPEGRGISYLADVEDPNTTTLWHQGWISGQFLGLSDEEQVEWGHYLRALRDTFTIFSNWEDELIWDHHPSGRYTPKHGYIQLNLEVHNRELVWWWKQLWKLKCPGKAKLLFWAILEHKAPTWDVLQKRYYQGSGFCSLYRKNEETSAQLFVSYYYTQVVWAEVCKMLRYNLAWHGQNVLEAFQNWWFDHNTPALRATPCIFAWGIWITWNKVIFQDCRVPLESIAAQVVSIVQHFKVLEKPSQPRGIREENIDKDVPWGYFDGASQEQQMLCGGGGVLYKTETHSFQFLAGLGRVTNNYAELMTL